MVRRKRTKVEPKIKPEVILSSSESEDEFEIIELIKVKTDKNGDKWYLVKWDGVNPDTNEPWAETWEPAHNIEIPDNDSLLKKFRKRLKSIKEAERIEKEKERASKREKRAAEKSRKNKFPDMSPVKTESVKQEPEADEEKTQKPQSTSKTQVPNKTQPQKQDSKNLTKKPNEEPETDSDLDDDEFVIEEILKCRTLRGQKQYLVKWGGLDEDGEPWQNSWEPAEMIETDDNKNLLDKFLKQSKNQNGQPKRKRVKAEREPDVDFDPNDQEEDSKTKRKTARKKPSTKENRNPKAKTDAEKRRELINNENILRQQQAAQKKKELLVLKPEILDQRKFLEKGQVAFNLGQLAEALRLYEKANRIHSDSRSLAAISQVKEILIEEEQKLEKERLEEEAKRQKYINMTDDDRNLANYIEYIIKSELHEPLRKNPNSPVSKDTFEFFIGLLNHELPNTPPDQRIEQTQINLLTGHWKRLDHPKFLALEAEVKKLVTKKLRKLSRQIHPDKCRLTQKPWCDMARDAMAFVNKGKDLIEKFLNEHHMASSR